MSAPPAPTRSARLLKTVMGAGLLLTGLGFTAWLFHAGQRALVTRGWSAVPCVIVSSRLAEKQFSDYSPLTWQAEVSYRYEVDGVPRTGTRVKRVEGATPHRDRAEARAAAYPAGMATTCYVDPADADSAVLEHDTKAPFYTLWWPLLFAAGGAGMIWSAWRRNPAAQPTLQSPAGQA